MSLPLKIDFVSDVSCPWCVIGLNAFEQALARLPMTVDATFHFQPFELNPDMPPEGQDITEHIAQKYGATAEQSAANREAIRARGEALGFTFSMAKRGRIYNTFDAHRLLHWAELKGKQYALKRALFVAYFTEGRDPSSRDVLLSVADAVGLDTVQAAAILNSDAFSDDVRERERFYLDQNIHSVPAIIINDRYLLQGGQPVEAFEAALLQILSK
ncbi:MAG: DsbA family oxidoreductase [Herminiimonas sp.]|nr:DsbA family oxidoreductase [Herminiimonas sp.]